MKKILSLIVLGSMVLAACGGSSGATAATVDEVEITVGDVNDLIDVGSAVIAKEQFAQFLAFAIQWEIIAVAAEADYGFAATDDEISAEADSIFENVAVAGETREEFLESRQVTELFLENIARQSLTDAHIRAALEQLAPTPTADDLVELANEARAALTNVCVSHILVDTEEEALAIFDRLDAGEEFSALAEELSTDPGSGANGGSLGCAVAADYVPEFRDASVIAPVGEVYSEIVGTSFGYHVLLVTDREDAPEDLLPTDEELAENFLDGWVAIEIQAWFDATMIEAVVTVEAEFGTWQPTPPTVIPPQS